MGIYSEMNKYKWTYLLVFCLSSILFYLYLIQPVSFTPCFISFPQAQVTAKEFMLSLGESSTEVSIEKPERIFTTTRFGYMFYKIKGAFLEGIARRKIYFPEEKATVYVSCFDNEVAGYARDEYQEYETLNKFWMDSDALRVCIHGIENTLGIDMNIHNSGAPEKHDNQVWKVKYNRIHNNVPYLRQGIGFAIRSNECELLEYQKEEFGTLPVNKILMDVNEAAEAAALEAKRIISRHDNLSFVGFNGEPKLVIYNPWVYKCPRNDFGCPPVAPKRQALHVWSVKINRLSGMSEHSVTYMVDAETGKVVDDL